jgi:hypothetical protein
MTAPFALGAYMREERGGGEDFDVHRRDLPRRHRFGAVVRAEGARGLAP